MNKRILIPLLCVFLFTQLLHGALPGIAEIKKENANPITLKGKLVTGTISVKSVPVLPAVEAILQTTSLEIAFNSSLGNLTVTVVNQQNFPVYQQTVNATSGSSLTINTGSWSNGTYTLFITNSSGGCLEGQFNK